MIKGSEIKVLSLSEIERIIETVKTHHGFDFRNYAPTSFQRRVLRIMEIFKLPTVDDLIEKIKTSSNFYDVFLSEVTVNTTEMFRDPEMWVALKDIVSALHEAKPNQKIKIWHAGCSSGEEVFSMAILLKELGLYDDVKITATDINSTVLEKAASGIYPVRNMQVNTMNYEKFGGKNMFNSYCTYRENNVEMDSHLLECVEFVEHNLVQAEQLGTYDIILCRNVMIYFNKILQDEVFKLFYKSLEKGGYLVIGAKESLVWCSLSDKFEIVNSKEKIFKKIR